MEKTQREIVLEELRKGKWFSTVDAVKLYILRLGAIIFVLRKDGYNIIERKVANKNYSEYRLVRNRIELPPAYPDKKPTTAKLL